MLSFCSLSSVRTDTHLSVEFNHIRQWASIKKMILNLLKTKEIVFRRPCPKRFHLPPALDGIEQVDQFKCLGVIFQHSLSFESHVVSLLKQCSQRIYLLKMLRIFKVFLLQNSILSLELLLYRAYCMPCLLGVLTYLVHSLAELMPFSSVHTDVGCNGWRALYC